MFKLVLFLSLVTVASAASAAPNLGGLFIEPMITYERGEAEIDFPAPFGSETADNSGFGVGARLGFHVNDVIFVAADGRYSMLEFDNNDPDFKTDATAYNLGLVLGVQMPTPFALRVWGTYIAAAQMDLNEDKEVDLELKDANGYRVGAGVKLAMVSLNLEYQVINYDKLSVESAGIYSGSTSNLDADNRSYILSVSFPFEL